MIAAGMKEVAGCVVRFLRGPFFKFKIISRQYINDLIDLKKSELCLKFSYVI